MVGSVGGVSVPFINVGYKWMGYLGPYGPYFTHDPWSEVRVWMFPIQTIFTVKPGCVIKQQWVLRIQFYVWSYAIAYEAHGLLPKNYVW
jgi:hypothetical protein